MQITELEFQTFREIVCCEWIYKQKSRLKHEGCRRHRELCLKLVWCFWSLTVQNSSGGHHSDDFLRIRFRKEQVFSGTQMRGKTLLTCQEMSSSVIRRGDIWLGNWYLKYSRDMYCFKMSKNLKSLYRNDLKCMILQLFLAMSLATYNSLQ